MGYESFWSERNGAHIMRREAMRFNWKQLFGESGENRKSLKKSLELDLAIISLIELEKKYLKNLKTFLEHMLPISQLEDFNFLLLFFLGLNQKAKYGM